MDIKYRGLKSKGWRPGLSADHIDYILRELALEQAEAQLGRPISNMGETVEEIIACWRALEAVEAGYRANAKVQYRIVWNLPHDLDADQRRVLVEEFCERTFGRLGLPYVAAIHEPDAAGDRRNHHAHICFSTRPCERIGDHQWAVAEEKVNGLTDKPGLRLERALAAAHMNRACRAAGMTTLFTHQTYAERGLDAERQAHVGPEAMAAHDRGEAVGVIARNAAIVERNETAIARQQVERQLDATLHLQRLLEEADRAAHRRSPARAGREAADALLEAAKGATRRVVRQVRSGERLGARALELRTRAVRVQRRLQVLPRRAPTIQPVARLVKDVARLGHHPATARKRPAPAVSVAVSRLSTHAHSTGAALAARLVRNIGMTTERLPPASTLVRLGTAIAAAQVSASRARADLREIKERHSERNAAAAVAREAAVRDAVLTSTALLVTVENGRLRANLGVLAVADRDAFLELDAGIQRTLLIDRHAADQQRQRDNADRIRAVDLQRERDADAARQVAARIKEACRILREAEIRPYRRKGRTLHLDFARLSATDRDVVASVGIGDPSLRAALIARATSDAQIDAAAIVGPARSPATAEPLPANTTPATGTHGGDDRIGTALAVLRTRDDWVRQDGDGLFTFSEAALRAAGLGRADIVTPNVQREIEAIGFEQVDRFDPVLADVSGDSPFLVDQSKIRLDPRFPAALRDDVARWSDEPQFRAFAATVWPHLGIDRTPAPGEIDNAAGVPPPTLVPPAVAAIDPWFQAAAVRQRAMADWDATERHDDIGMARPGQPLARPGRDAPGAEIIPEPVRLVRLHPGMIPGGSGMGG